VRKCGPKQSGANNQIIVLFHRLHSMLNNRSCLFKTIAVPPFTK
jgi:hypothetical protein